MMNQPSGGKSQGQQAYAKTSGNVTNLSGAITQYRHQSTIHQKHQNGINNNLLLDILERTDQLIRSKNDPSELCADFLNFCLEIFDCDQAWFLSTDKGNWSIPLFSCRQHASLERPSCKSFDPSLSLFFKQVYANNRPLSLSTATLDPLPIGICEPFDCHSLLLMPLTIAQEPSAILTINQCQQVRIWSRDEVRLFQELSHRLSDGLGRLDAERRFKENEKRFHSLQQNTLDAIPLALIGIDAEKKTCHWNLETEKLLGISAEVALGNFWDDLLPDLPLRDNAIQKAISTGTGIHLGRFPWTRNKPSKLLELILSPSNDKLASHALIWIDDATEQAQIEEHAIQQEKMASVGNMAAGVAHEINNPLAGILQNLQVLRNRLHPNLPKNITSAHACGIDIDSLDSYINERGIHAILNTAIESGQKAADIVHNMLNFSRKDDSSFQNHNLCSLLDKAVELATCNYNLDNRLDFRKIEISRHYEKNVPNLYCSPGQLQQVFLNLLSNGAHAMGKRLEFWEKHSNTLPSSEKPRFTLRLQKRHNQLRCEIEDNGCGMNETVRKRVFEPFYTTKKTGEGTGLGMSICYFIVNKNHNGQMSVESRPDVGSRFIMTFPLPTEN